MNYILLTKTWKYTAPHYTPCARRAESSLNDIVLHDLIELDSILHINMMIGIMMVVVCAMMYSALYNVILR